MKNATRHCAGPVYYRMCSTDVYCSKQTAAVAPKETITHHFFVSELGRRKLSMQPKFVAAQKMLLNSKPANIRKWIVLFFYYFRHLYSAGSACVLLTHQAERPSIWATLSALLINRFLGSFQLFLHSDQPLSEGNNPAQRCLPVGGGCIIHAGGGTAHRPTDCLMYNRRRPAASTLSRRASFSALASANSSHCIERGNITLTHLHVSNCRVRQLQFSGIFFNALGFVGNGVITVMINSP